MTDQIPVTADTDNGSELGAMVAEVRTLADEARDYARAELAFQKARAGHAGKSLKGIAAFGALALALVFFALMALAVGMVLALTPMIGAWGAAGASFLILLGAAGLCGMIAYVRVKRMLATISDKGSAKVGVA